jgi:hypothetical protein
MAAHRYHHQGWLDTPVHPALGVTMFVVGALALFLTALFVASAAVLL